MKDDTPSSSEAIGQPKVDFWLLSRDPVERVVALIAEKVRAGRERLLVIHVDAAQRKAISRALWEHKPEAFLANGEADATGADRQPILLCATCDAINGARKVVLADGTWREEALGFERAVLLFGEDRRAEARQVWSSLDGKEGLERSFFAQEGGRWVKKA